MTGRLILVRHGESEGNATLTFTRSPEAPLTVAGENQARRSARLIQADFRPTCLISSPYRRAMQTAEIIGELLDLPLSIEDDLREQSMGELRGQPYQEALDSHDFQSLPRWKWRPPNGETLIEVQARALPAVLRIAQSSPDSDVVLVSHGGTIRALWAHAAGGWEETHTVANGSLLVIPHDGESLGRPDLRED
jgi:probable phosphoglycerate mutase